MIFRHPKIKMGLLAKNSLYNPLILLVPRIGVEPMTCPLGGGRAIHCATEAYKNKNDASIQDRNEIQQS
jgi:hypothetical protein